MNPERWGRIKQICHSALELDPGRREVYLKGACADDEGLLKEVASLLAQKGKSEGLFESPAMVAVAQALARDQAQKPEVNLIGQTVSHYRIEGKIGEGGMGVVFLAQDSSLHRKVAMKFLPPEMQQYPLARKRFLREARSAAALDNPYICSIHEVGESEGRDFIVMEYVDGQTLADKLRRGRLPLNQALQVAMEVAEALQAAHGIWHIDLRGPSQTPTVPLPLIRSTLNQMFPTYSPDGKRIAYMSDISGHDEIWTCDGDGSNAAQLTSFGFAPAWPPDGMSILFLGNMGINIVSANGGSPRHIAMQAPQSIPWSSWSRDGQCIYFRSQSSGSSEIWKVPSKGGNAVQITPNGHDRDLPQESPDGKYLYYSNADHFPEQCSVWRVPTAGGEETNDSTACLQYAIGERGIYFFTPPDKQGHSDIDFYNFATGETREILTLEHWPSSITVSPNGGTVLYTQDDQAGSDLMLVDHFR
jgi:serine/threonine protein kinase